MNDRSATNTRMENRFLPLSFTLSPDPQATQLSCRYFVTTGFEAVVTSLGDAGQVISTRKTTITKSGGALNAYAIQLRNALSTTTSTPSTSTRRTTASTASATAPVPTQAAASALSTAGIVGVAIGSAIGGILLCVVLYFLYRLRRGKAAGRPSDKSSIGSTYGPPATETGHGAYYALGPSELYQPLEPASPKSRTTETQRGLARYPAAQQPQPFPSESAELQGS
jgi:hypothetical protein